jgi:hypothetical protein
VGGGIIIGDNYRIVVNYKGGMIGIEKVQRMTYLLYKRLV